MEYMINKIHVDPSQSPIFVSDQNQENSDKEKLIELTFEKFQSPAFYTAKKAALSMFANGRTTGFILDSGSGQTQVLPISDGYILKKGLKTFNFAGENLTKKVMDLLENKAKESGGKFSPFFDFKYQWDGEENRNAVFEPLEGVRDSVRNFFKMKIARDAKEMFFAILNDKQLE